MKTERQLAGLGEQLATPFARSIRLSRATAPRSVDYVVAQPMARHRLVDVYLDVLWRGADGPLRPRSLRNGRIELATAVRDRRFAWRGGLDFSHVRSLLMDEAAWSR